MRAFVLHAPGEYAVEEVPDPVAAPGEVVVAVERAGVCGTDVECFHGKMAYQQDGTSQWPLHIGHEWCGRVTEVGDGVDPSWLGKRVAGDTMLGCQHCRRCLKGRQHVCEQRQEVGLRLGRKGALAEQLTVPAFSLHELPDGVDAAMGAMVEPGGNALRAAQGTNAGEGDRVLVIGPGTIGLLTGLFLQARGAEVHFLGEGQRGAPLLTTLGFEHLYSRENLPDQPYDAVVDCANDPAMPKYALDLVEPGGRLVYIGLSGEQSTIDAQCLTLKDVTAVGVLSASPGLVGAIEAYASGQVDPRPLIAATVALSEIGDVLAGHRPAGAGQGPKIHVDPTLP